MRVVVLGSSGLLGRSICDRMLAGGHDVVGVSLDRGGSARMHASPGCTEVRCDLVAASDVTLDAVLEGADALVWCLGPDDRVPLPTPLAETFERLLVAPAVRAAQSAARQGVGRFVLLGSYFATFDRLHPQWRLAERHPYVRARVEQAARVERELAPGVFSVLEIPFVFGAVEGVTPMWKDVFFDKFRLWPFGLSLPGRSAAVDCTDVAEAAYAVVTGAVEPGRVPLSVDTVTYAHLARLVLDELGRRRVPVWTVPGPLTTLGLLWSDAQHRVLSRRAAGLDPRYLFGDLLARDLSLDPAAYAARAGLTPRGLDDAIRASVRAAYPTRFPAA